MARVINRGWKEPDPNAPWTIRLVSKKVVGKADGSEPEHEGNAADIPEPTPPTSSGAES
jgi:hypothetical protein